MGYRTFHEVRHRSASVCCRLDAPHAKPAHRLLFPTAAARFSWNSCASPPVVARTIPFRLAGRCDWHLPGVLDCDVLVPTLCAAPFECLGLWRAHAHSALDGARL